jgi:DNA-binding transcriptional LysR family regulator
MYYGGVRMTLQQLKYFVEMCKTLHYTKAAEKLNISQPSLSYALNQLSEELGVPLFEMNGKKVILTKYSEVFLSYVESALGVLAQGEQQLKTMMNPQGGIVNLGYIYSVSFDAIPQLIDEFYTHQGNRNIHFSFQMNMTNHLIDELEKGTLDVVMAPAPDIVPDCISSIPVFNQELYLLVYNDHPLSDKSTVTIEDFKEEKLVMINKKTNLFIQTDALFKKHNIIPEIVFKVDECNSMAAFVGAKLGVAIMPKIPSLDRYKVVAIPFEDRKMTRAITLLWNNKIQHSSSVKTFLEYFTFSRTEKNFVNLEEDSSIIALNKTCSSSIRKLKQ